MSCPVCNGAGRVALNLGFLQIRATCPACMGASERVELPAPEEKPTAKRIRVMRARLGVADGASAAEVRTAWRKAVFASHPDRHPKATPQQRNALERAVASANEAYEILKGVE